MLLYKLLLNRVDGKVYNSIKSIYGSSLSRIRVNGSMTDWFDCTIGLKQGCNLSPTIFSIFANDLVDEINNLGVGVKVGEISVSILKYADDIVLLSDSEAHL